MKQNWDLDGLIEFWTLLPNERELLEPKMGVNRLIFALLLKFFQYTHKFPDSPLDIPLNVVEYLASQVNIPASDYYNYQWQQRSIMRFRGEIRHYLGIRKATDKDIEQMVDWLISEVLSLESNFEHLLVAVEQRWPMTSLLDVLKETDLRIGFSKSFKSFASRETLDRDVVQKRLLLCLYGLGTNTGLKRVSDGTPEINYHELRYIKRRILAFRGVA